MIACGFRHVWCNATESTTILDEDVNFSLQRQLSDATEDRGLYGFSPPQADNAAVHPGPIYRRPLCCCRMIMTVDVRSTYRQLQICVSEALGVSPALSRPVGSPGSNGLLGLTTRRAASAGRGSGAPPCPIRYRTEIERCLGNSVAAGGKYHFQVRDPI